MSQVLQFLESLGRDGAVAARAGQGYLAAVSSLDIDEMQRQALLDLDATALADLLGARPVMLCSIFPAEDPQREDEQSPDQEPDDTPQEDER